MKFTPPDGRISIKAEQVDAMVEISVRDSGPGIRAEFLPRVFERFSQQDTGIAREHGGLGLGLAIVRHLAEMHGGSVRATSTEGQGATFSLRIPFADATISGPTDDARDAQTALLTGVHVLVIDDERDAREFVRRMLEDQGAMVTAAGSASEGFDVLLSARPDILVCDIGMPNEDGLALITRVRKSREAAIASIPAVAVTAYARDQDRQQALRAGFQSHLAKPFTAHDLVTIVGKLAHGNGPPANVRQASGHS